MSNTKVTGRYAVKTVRVSIACDGLKDAYARDDNDVARIARAIYAQQGLDPDQEHFLVLSLNTRGRVAGFKCVAIGTLTTTLIHPREVFRAAIELGAASIVLVHNHPSGDPEPSSEDIELTARMRAAAEIMGIPVLDHVVITATSHVSLAARGDIK